MYHGDGIFFFRNEDQYEGHFVCDKANGYGVFFSDKNNEKYSGQWKDDKKDGFGEELLQGKSNYLGEYS